MTPYYQDNNCKVYHGSVFDILPKLPDRSVNCCVTSPPYWGLRDYGESDQIGLENTPELYISTMVAVFAVIKRILKDDGTIWVNIGDSYAGSGKGPGKSINQEQHHLEHIHSKIVPQGTKPKDLIGIPWMLAFALRADGWYLRQDIIWHKPNPMPESVTDRCTKSHEYIFLLSKKPKYYYDQDAIKENANNKYNGGGCKGRIESERWRGHTENVEGLKNKRSVWTVATQPTPDAHFATFPEKLITPCILAGCPKGGTVIDPFSGSGTTGLVSKNHRRNYIGIELNDKYIEISRKKLRQEVLAL